MLKYDVRDQIMGDIRKKAKAKTKRFYLDSVNQGKEKKKWGKKKKVFSIDA